MPRAEGCLDVDAGDTVTCMGMRLRLTSEETEELRTAAESAGVSLQSFIKQAALNAARERSARRDALVDVIRRDRREVLDRLGSVSDGDPRRDRPVEMRPVYADRHRVRTSTPTGENLDDLRGER